MAKKHLLLRLFTASCVVMLFLATSAVMQAQTACSAAYNSATAYSGGATVSENGINYLANWWTQGQDPATNNGPSGSGQPWTSQGACGGGTCSSVPAAPAALASSSLTSTSLALSWGAVTPPANCSIGSYTVLQNNASIGTATGTGFNVTGLTPSTTYSFSVEATDAKGTSAASSALQVTTPASCASVPSAPTGLASANLTSTSFTLSWGAVTPPSGCSISSYTVLQNGASIGTATGTSFSVTGLTASTTYSFTVKATDGNGASAASTALSVSTPSGGGGACATAWSATAVYTAGATASLNGENYVANFWTQNQSPATFSGPAGSGQPWTATGACSSCSVAPPTPTGLAATSITSNGATLGWTAVTPPTACTVSYKVQVTGQAATTTSTTTDAVTGLNSSATYTYTVAATDSAGSSAAASGSFTTLANPCTTKPASAPTNLSAANTTGSSTVLSWGAVTPPANCSISYTITGGPSTVNASGTTSAVGGLTPSTSYTFSVAATDYAGTGPASTITVKTTSAPPNGYFMAGWFEEWGTYYANSNVADLQNSGVVNSMTHLIYAFAKPSQSGSSSVCALSDTYADYQKAVPLVPGAPALPTGLAGNFGGLWQLKQLHPNLKLMISIGGWNPPTYNQAFEAASSSAANRQAFVSSCISTFIQGNIASGLTVPNLFDGIEIDWEFPNASDTANFTALMTEFRNELNTLSTSTGKTYVLAADLAAGPSTPGAALNSGNDGGYDTLDIAGLSAQLDYLNVDGYNYAGDWANATNDASPLYDEVGNPTYNTCTTKGANYIDCTVQYYLSHGAPPAKYTMGFPLYGVGWAGGLTSANSGMYQNATGVNNASGVLTGNGTTPVPLANGTGLCSSDNNQGSPAAGCDPLLTDGMATYGTLVNMKSHGFAVSYDPTRCATRMFNASTTPFTDWAYSYDDANSVACKVNYIKQLGLGGAYVWALKDDDSSGDLTKTIYTDLNQ